jgi:hypothetical protein
MLTSFWLKFAEEKYQNPSLIIAWEALEEGKKRLLPSVFEELREIFDEPFKRALITVRIIGARNCDFG